MEQTNGYLIYFLCIINELNNKKRKKLSWYLNLVINVYKFFND